ncbi:DUF6273 domain-containing protein [Succinimonas sp.]|uniref:DUF6273 domain-containing protein n=1 Tax=Succinimonas sp. TaxID=1936151 RepID=UPI00386F7142
MTAIQETAFIFFILLGIWSGRTGKQKPTAILMPFLAILMLITIAVTTRQMQMTPENSQVPPGHVFNPHGLKILGELIFTPLVAFVLFFIGYFLSNHVSMSQKSRRRPLLKNTGYQKTKSILKTPAAGTEPACEPPAEPGASSRDPEVPSPEVPSSEVLYSENSATSEGVSKGDSENTGTSSEKIREELTRRHLLKNHILTFGRYCQDNAPDSETPVEWIVLERQEHEILAISRFVLECRPYSDLKDSESRDTWSSCSLRTWLNREFLNRAFTPAEISLIKDSSVSDDTAGAYAADRIFCLSQAEFSRYLTATSIQKGIPTPHAIAGGAAVSGFSGNTSWWLRDTSDFMSHGGDPLAVDASGFRIRIPGTTGAIGVRPAIRIIL